jgi:hypothetical protein
MYIDYLGLQANNLCFHTIMINTPFWYDEPRILIYRESIMEIFPSKKFDIIRKLNAIVRLTIIYAFIMYVYKREKTYLVIPFVAMGITWVIKYKQGGLKKDAIYKKSVSDQLNRLVDLDDLETECSIPTKDNPFMNPRLRDFGNNGPLKPKACPTYNNIGAQKRVDELFNEDLYRDVTDVFGKGNSQRQFYTVPGNQIPNDQGGFAQWLYGRPPSCKEGNGVACLSQTGRASGNVGAKATQ